MSRAVSSVVSFLKAQNSAKLNAHGHHSLTPQRSSNVNLAQLTLGHDLTRPQVLDQRIAQPGLARMLHQAALRVHAAAGEHHEVIIDMALVVVGVRHVARERVQLRRADGAHAAARAAVGRCNVADGRAAAVARGCLERREPGLQRDVEERVRGHAEELVVRLDEEVGQRGPARGVVHFAVLCVHGVGRKGEEHGSMAVFVREGIFEGVEVLAGEDDGFKELILTLGADELDVLLEAELELEATLLGVGINSGQNPRPGKEG